MTPKVSVIVATYRREAALATALTSLSHQTFRDFEVIVVDDNGDPSWNAKVKRVIEQYRSTNPATELNYIVNQTNLGSARTRNVAIDASRGEYITFLDDDDVYLPFKIEKQVEFMEDGQYDYSVTDLNLYNESDTLIDRRNRNYIKDTSSQALLGYHLKHHLTGTDTMMFRKEYLIKIGGFAPIDVGDEFYLMQRAIDGDGKFGYLPRCDIKAYIHVGEGGLSSGDGKIKGENALYEYKKTFFDRLDSATKRYIKMRHYAVIAFAEIRRKHMFSFVVNTVKSLLCAPLAFFRMVLFER